MSCCTLERHVVRDNVLFKCTDYISREWVQTVVKFKDTSPRGGTLSKYSPSLLVLGSKGKRTYRCLLGVSSRRAVLESILGKHERDERRSNEGVGRNGSMYQEYRCVFIDNEAQIRE